MAASKVINQQSFHDGKVVLYQLENRPKKLWLCQGSLVLNKSNAFLGLR
jgi:hypothetical protein